jgi:filamentous hemagglutinin
MQTCSDSMVSTLSRAQGANADAALANMKTGAIYAAPAGVLGLIGPEAVTAAAIATAFDYEGDAVSYAMGLSKDKPNFTKSYATGVISGMFYPFAIGDATISGLTTAGKLAANTYNAGVSGVVTFGAAQ